MKRYVVLAIMVALCSSSVQAQFRYGYPYRHRQPSPQRQRFSQLPKFTPSVNITFGYGFPNLDKVELLDFYNYYKGSVSQTGPVFGTVDYQFSRTMSIGIMASYGKVSIPYYDYNAPASDPAVLTGKLENWSVMINFVRYIPVVTDKITPYMRTALGINSWSQNYIDQSGNKAVNAPDPSSFAYQVGLGAKFKLSKNAGLFLEAGYGKYILSGGLAFKF
ncbi:MAG: outer membrane beta-barrel protein [Bacteroidota bacterium]|nr:outer membrane beta-barrel protein [Bacteroidota bacterium]